MLESSPKAMTEQQTLASHSNGSVLILRTEWYQPNTSIKISKRQDAAITISRNYPELLLLNNKGTTPKYILQMATHYELPKFRSPDQTHEFMGTGTPKCIILR